MAISGPIERLGNGVTGKYFMYAAGTRGAPVIFSTRPGSAAGLASGKWGDPENAVAVPSGTAGQFAGILQDNVEDFDESRYCYYPQWYGNNTTTCRPVAVIEQGVIFTDQIESADTPTRGADVFWSANGLFTTAAGSVKVGEFTGTKDAKGFAGIDLDKKV